MKPYDKNIEAEITKTMKLLDEMKPLEVHHLFRVRVMQRVEVMSSQKSGRMTGAGGGVADFRFAFIALLLVVNIGSALLLLQNGQIPVHADISALSDTSGEDYSSQEFAYYEQTGNDLAATGGNEKTAP